MQEKVKLKFNYSKSNDNYNNNNNNNNNVKFNESENFEKMFYPLKPISKNNVRYNV